MVLADTTMPLSTISGYSSSDSLTRLLVAISDTQGTGALHTWSSNLLYIDYESCETIFYIKNYRSIIPGFNSIAIDTF